MKRMALAAALSAAAAVALAVHFDHDRSHASATAGLAAGVAAQARADAFADIASRIYGHEHASIVARSAVKHLRAHQTLLRARRTGARRLIRWHARPPVAPHAA